MSCSLSVTFVRTQILRGLDPLLIAGALAVAATSSVGAPPRGSDEWLPILFLIPTSLAVFNLGGGYRALASPHLSLWCRQALLGLFGVVGVFLATAYATSTSDHFPRSAVMAWILSSAALLVAARMVAYRLSIGSHRCGLGIDRVILAGVPGHCYAFRRHLEAHPDLGLAVVGIASDAFSDEADGAWPNGSLARLPQLVEGHDATRVIVCGELSDQKIVLDVMNLLLRHPVTVQYAPDYSTIPIFTFRVGDCGGRPLMDLSSSPLGEAALALKWIEDKVFSIAILALIMPLLGVIAAAVKITSPGPVLFIQERHGINGKPIRVYKFRTMRHAAAVSGPEDDGGPALEARSSARSPSRRHRSLRLEAAVAMGLERFTHELNRFGTRGAMLRPSAALVAQRIYGDLAPDDFVQAKPNDPRITPIGNFLRKTSLDELPQFFNVLKGDMSIVGPRPHAIKHNQQFAVSIGELMRRHYVKPGITGLAQINGARGETRCIEDMRRRISLDLEYIRSWSLWLDIKIIVLTVVRGFINRQP
jgi:exopolysaccharide biosynthesis polyprenyl glycosylphosphotransferase